MQTVMIDSSIWISYLAIDSNSKKARRFFRLLLKRQEIKVAVPEIIYLEVMNTLTREKLSQKEIQKFNNILKLKPTFSLVKMNKKIYRKAAKLTKILRLKTLDLIILTTALDLKVNRLYTYDKKLQKAYQFIKNYEKTSKKYGKKN